MVCFDFLKVMVLELQGLWIKATVWTYCRWIYSTLRKVQEQVVLEYEILKLMVRSGGVQGYDSGYRLLLLVHERVKTNEKRRSIFFPSFIFTIDIVV